MVDLVDGILTFLMRQSESMIAALSLARCELRRGRRWKLRSHRRGCWSARI